MAQLAQSAWTTDVFDGIDSRTANDQAHMSTLVAAFMSKVRDSAAAVTYQECDDFIDSITAHEGLWSTFLSRMPELRLPYILRNAHRPFLRPFARLS